MDSVFDIYCFIIKNTLYYYSIRMIIISTYLYDIFLTICFIFYVLCFRSSMTLP